MSPSSHRSAQRGISLVELMVAMAISLALMSGIIQIFVSTKTTFKMDEGLARLQENGRYAFEMLARDIRMAGYLGCPGLDEVEPNNIVKNSAADVILDLDNLVSGLDDAADGNAYSAVVGTDVIVVRGAFDSGARLTGNMDADNANLQIDGNPANFEQGDILLVTDCQAADLFKATTVSQAAGKTTIAHANNFNTTNKLSKLYQENARILAFDSFAYYVASTGRNNGVGDPVLALYRDDLSSTQELVEGVEDLQVSYGIDTDGDRLANRYVRAEDTAFDAGSVVSARVVLLLNSVDVASPTPQAYTFQGETVADPGDRLLRREFSTTVVLRNRVS